MSTLHPWHQVSPGNNIPEIVNAIIEIPKGSKAKYEIDKESGLLKLDRVLFSSVMYPANYGFIPQTYCGDKVAEFAMKQTGRKAMKGDKDPLDILVLTERTISSGDIILEAIPIGGFRMIDKDEADDKIIAVMAKDEIFSQWQDIGDCPEAIIKRLKHYFLTYKNMPGLGDNVCEITDIYGRAEAHEVIRRSIEDYNRIFKS